MPKVPRFDEFRPASEVTSRVARASSHKQGTRCELHLRRALWSLGFRYRIDTSKLPGRPDIVFIRSRVVVFCDGDFWHGRHLKDRLAKLSKGHNAPYWVAKIRANVERDRRNNEMLARAGWLVLRYWETDILRDVSAIAAEIATQVALRRAN